MNGRHAGRRNGGDAALIGVIARELTSRRPIVNLRLFRNRTNAIANLLMFVLYGGVMILPQFPQVLMGCGATDAGMVLSRGGIAMVSTIVTRRTQVHDHDLVMHLTRYDKCVRVLSARMTQALTHAGLNTPEAAHMAVAGVYQGMQAQAATLGYLDAYFAMAVLCAAMVRLAFLMKRSDPSRGIVIG
ncbi:MAG TPA: hypothetical protein VMV27_09780 [Candidatus Binataceae bacterium]|nr:hypothetical protein [Candidatus Binataceae bacterium]